MLKARGITVRFGGLVAVDKLDLDIPEAGIFALVGPNGAGKSTLISALSRLCPITEGSIQLDDLDLLTLMAHQINGIGISRSFQHAELFPTLTVLENVLVGLHSRIDTGLGGAFMTRSTRKAERDGKERAEQLLRDLNLWQLRDFSPADLPHGHQKLLDVARALVSEPKLLLLDEPFAGLTDAETPQLLECISEAGKRCAVLMIEHHFDLLEGIASRMTVMNFGRKIAEGTPAAIRVDPEVIRCYLGDGGKNSTEALPC